MNSDDTHASMEEIAGLLETVRRKGVRLWTANDQLHYVAPKGVLTQLDMDRLRVSKERLVTFLKGTAGVGSAEPEIEPRVERDRAPLAFSQLSRWHSLQSGELPNVRQVASATRLHGRLNVDALQNSIVEIIRRHDALRTRVVVHDGIPSQEIDESVDLRLEVIDLTEDSKPIQEIKVTRLIEQLVLQPIDIAVDPLFGVLLAKLRDDEHVLILAMEHLISDGVSLNLLERDLFNAYAQAASGRTFTLPAIQVQFADYAAWQRNSQEECSKAHGAFWTERLKGIPRLTFPEQSSLLDGTRLGWGTIPIRVGMDLKAELREWCRLRRTTLAMGAFTAFAGLMLRWCHASCAVFQYQSDGRVSRKVENTVGCFTTALYMRVEAPENGCLADLMNQLIEEYCIAYEHADFSYMEAQLPRPELIRNAVFNWVPQGPDIDLSDLHGSKDAITCSPVPFLHPMLRRLELDRDPGILLFDTVDDVIGGLYFPLNRFSTETMEKLGRNFLVFLRNLLEQPEGRIKGFPLAP